jgi:hypothetical protein
MDESLFGRRAPVLRKELAKLFPSPLGDRGPLQTAFYNATGEEDIDPSNGDRSCFKKTFHHLLDVGGLPGITDRNLL